MTNPEIIVIDTISAHIREMSSAMHAETAETARKLGMEPHKALWHSYRKSLICRSIFIDGKIAAIFGIGGVMLGEVGQPFLVMTPEVDEYPMRVAFAYKRELRKMAEMFPVLEDYIDETNEKGIGMLKLMGFKISKNKIPLGDAVLLHAERRA